jgi:hypothetical protein
VTKVSIPPRRRVLVVVGVLLVAIGWGAWWWTRVTPPVTEAAARTYLTRIVAAARAHDFDRLCGLNGSVLMCRDLLVNEGLERSVPSDAPTVVGTRYLHEHDGYVAGRVLVVEGRTPCGQRYRTEVFVFRENRFHYKAINAVYWSNARITDSGGVASPGGAPPPTC